MGKIVSFRPKQNVISLQSVQNKAETNGKRLEYRKNNPERWRPAEERTRITDMEEITPSVDYAVGRFRWCVEKLASQGLLDYTLFEQSFPKHRLSDGGLDFEASCEIEHLDYSVQCTIAFEIIEAIHDGWVSDMGEDFFSLFIDREYFFMPIELVGIGRLSPYYRSIEPHLDCFGLRSVKWEHIVEVYDERRREFIRRHRIRKPSDLIDVITGIADTYLSLKPKVAEVMKERELAFDIAQQISARSPELFHRLQRY